MWGGGPEILALANKLRLRVEIYKLTHRPLWSRPHKFNLRKDFSIGSDHNAARTVKILLADGRFPDVRIGRQSRIGDHFMPIFHNKPFTPSTYYVSVRNKMKSLVSTAVHWFSRLLKCNGRLELLENEDTSFASLKDYVDKCLC